jgi:hypothetical protein
VKDLILLKACKQFSRGADAYTLITLRNFVIADGWPLLAINNWRVSTTLSADTHPHAKHHLPVPASGSSSLHSDTNRCSAMRIV